MTSLLKALGLFFLSTFAIPMSAQVQDNPYLQLLDNGQLALTEAGASHFAGLALTCLEQEYPNKLNQVLVDSSALKSPRALHPAFYGCFDWHSSVHGHWMLVRLLRTFPKLPEAPAIREALDRNLSAENIAGEVAYFKTASKSWERMYGWSWLLKLAEELHNWKDPQAQRWSANLKPLSDILVARYMAFLPKQSYPVRTGVHPNTAFGLSFAWDYAQVIQQDAFSALIAKRAKDYYAEDQNCPAHWEPSGEDFLSACLEEANLMQRVLPSEEFEQWLAAFLPSEQLTPLLNPADVSDRSDPKIVHLDGLNLSRAWCMYRIAASIKQVALRAQLVKAANQHLLLTVPEIASEHYEGTHWLASFAVYALSSIEE
ncbi:MAG: DUF2891 domain-containing protein [Bacteroidota bacterium]